MDRNALLSLVIALTLPFAVTVRASEADAQADEGPVMELSLEQAIEMALENNLDIVVSRLGAQAQGERVGVARGAYRPFFSFNFNNLKTNRPANNQLSGAPTLKNETRTYNFVWRQLLPTGGTYEIDFNNSRATTNSAFFTFNPRFDSSLGIQASQPLVKNFRFDPTKQQIVVARNNERVTRHQFEVR